MSARWYPVRIKAKPQLLSSSPTSIITVITSSSYGIASLSTQLGVRFEKIMVFRVVYDQHFDSSELRQINRLRVLDTKRQQIAWFVGVIAVMLIFVAQVPYHGTAIVHALATYGCLPGGIGAGLFTYVRLESYIGRAFSEKWDPLFFQRSGHASNWWHACDERNWLLEQSWFYGLSKKEQGAQLKRIDRKYGL
jgi:hypothetical protein